MEKVMVQEGKSIGGVYFTSREVDILACMACGHVSTKEISHILSISSSTVNIHIGNILSKLKCQSRHQVASFLSKNAENRELHDFFYCFLYKEALFNQALKKIGQSLRLPRQNYYLVQSTKHKKEMERLQAYLSLLGMKTIFISSDQALPAHPTSWRIYAKDDTSSKWFIVPCLPQSLFQEGELLFTTQEKIHLEKPTEGYTWDFFIKLLEFSLPKGLLAPAIEALNDQKHAIPAQRKGLSNPLISFWKIILINNVRTIGLLFALILAIGLVWNLPNPYISNLPLLTTNEKNKVFIDRPDVLKQISQTLEHQNNKIASIALVGADGAGKTTIIQSYARIKNFTIAWEMDAHCYETIMQSFWNLACALGKNRNELKTIESMPHQPEREAKLIAFVQKHLRRVGNWLLIYKNLEKMHHLSFLFPIQEEQWGKGCVICTYTSRPSYSLPNHQEVLELGLLNESESFELLRQALGWPNKLSSKQAEQIHSLLAKLPHFPLDITVAAQYIKQTGLSIEQYLEKLEASFAPRKEKNELYTREAIIKLSFQEIEYSKADFLPLALLTSLMNSPSISKAILSNVAPSDMVELFLRTLQRWGLIREEERGNTFSVHPFVQKVIREIILPYHSVDLNRLAQTIDNYAQSVIDQCHFHEMLNLVAQLEVFQQYLPRHKLISKPMLYFHTKSYAHAASDIEGLLRQGLQDKDQLFTLYLYAGKTYQAMNLYDWAEESIQKGTALCNQAFPESFEKQAQLIAQLAHVYHLKKDEKRTKELCDKAILLYRKAGLAIPKELSEMN